MDDVYRWSLWDAVVIVPSLGGIVLSVTTMARDGIGCADTDAVWAIRALTSTGFHRI